MATHDRDIKAQAEQVAILLHPNTVDQKAFKVVWPRNLEAEVLRARRMYPTATLGLMPIATKEVTILEAQS